MSQEPGFTEEDMAMAHRKIQLLMAQSTLIYLRELVERDPFITVTQVLAKAELHLVRMEIRVQGGSADLARREQFLEQALSEMP